MAEPKFKKGDRVRLLKRYASYEVGYEFVVNDVIEAEYDYEKDSYLVYGDGITCYEFRLEKVEDNVSVDLNKVKWRKVTRSEYDEASFVIPHRSTIVNLAVVKHELGTLPAELPTQQGAIVGKEGENPYAFDGDTWWYFNGGNTYDVNDEEVQEALDEKGYAILFPGVN
jgi:hypothetical protein